MRKNIVLIGHGYWGRNLERVINNNKALFNLVSIVDKKYEKKEFNSIYYFNDVKQLIKNKISFDCAVVATPANQHYLTTKLLLENGINCLVEKPFVLKTSHAEELFKLAEKNKLNIMVDNTFLYDNSIIKMIETVKKISFGQLLHISFERTNLGPLRNDTSALWDLTSHDISILLAINNKLPNSIKASGARFINKKNNDVVISTFLQDTTFVSSISSWLHPEKTRMIKIVGEKEMAIWNGMDLNQELKVFSQKKNTKNSISNDPYINLTNTKNSGYYVPFIRKSEPLDSVFKDFYNMITNQKVNIYNSTELIINQTKLLEKIDKLL